MMEERKKEALARLVNRIMRFASIKKLSAPKEILANEIRLIKSVFETKDIDPIIDRDLIRQGLIHCTAMMIANDRFNRIGLRGNGCSDCTHVITCDLPEDFDTATVCKNFVKRLEPSREDEFKLHFASLHRAYGIDKSRDLPEVQRIAEEMKKNRNSVPFYWPSTCSR